MEDDRRNALTKNEIPYMEKFMVPQMYDIFRFGGESVKDEEEGIQRMLKYFGKYFTEEQLKNNMERYNLQRMFEIVKKYFKKEYGYEGGSIILSNQYQHTINCYIYDDHENPSFVHIDELFESTVFSFLVAMFKWSKDFDNLEVYGECFKFILYLLNDVCIFGEMQGVDANDAILGLVSDDLQILQLAEECYWAIVVFSLAHEVAHAYLSSIGKKYTEKHPEKEEYDADMIAYHILLKIIMEEQQEECVIEEYAYLAPMIYMNFFDLYYYTDYILYKSRFSDPLHPSPIDRRDRLVAVVDKDEYDFDTVNGNHLYGGFLDVYDEYKNQLFWKMKKGKLDKILRTERRNQMRRNNNDETGSNRV